MNLGASKVFVEEEVKMAALGGGVDIYKPAGNLVIDMGEEQQILLLWPQEISYYQNQLKLLETT